MTTGLVHTVRSACRENLKTGEARAVKDSAENERKAVRYMLVSKSECGKH
jgi:hypothetical protein